MVVAAVGGDPLRPASWSPYLAAHRRHALDQRHELGYVVAVAACERPCERDPGRIDQEVVLRSFLARSTGLGPVAAPPFSLVHGWSQRPHAPIRSRPPPAARSGGARAASPTRLPSATRPGGGSRSSRRRS